jgi:hypothetical protein
LGTAVLVGAFYQAIKLSQPSIAPPLEAKNEGLCYEAFLVILFSGEKRSVLGVIKIFFKI